MSSGLAAPPSDDALRIRSVLKAVLVITAAWVPPNLAIAVWKGLPIYLYICALLLGVNALTAVSMQRAARGLVAGAALLDGWSFLIFAFLLVFAVPHAGLVLLGVPLIAVSLVVPFVRGRTLQLFAV